MVNYVPGADERVVTPRRQEQMTSGPAHDGVRITGLCRNCQRRVPRQPPPDHKARIPGVSARWCEGKLRVALEQALRPGSCGVDHESGLYREGFVRQPVADQ